MKTGSIFDVLDNERPTDGKEGFFRLAEDAPSPKDDSFFAQLKDYSKTALKGAIEGTSRLGLTIGPLIGGKSSQEQLEEQTQTLNELLPTDEGASQKALRRGLGIAPTALAFPGGPASQTAIRSGLAGVSGQAAEEAGFGETGQAVAETLAFAAPSGAKKLIPSGKKAGVIETGRKLGMSDEQITPLIQGETKQRAFSKFAKKAGRAERQLAETKEGLGAAYDALRDSPSSSQLLPKPSQDKLLKSLAETSKKMPAAVRELVEKDMQDLIKGPLTGNSLMNLHADINYATGPRSKQLSLFKPAIREAIKDISPELAKDFDDINNLYSKFFPIARKLKPTFKDQIIGAVEDVSALLGATHAVITFNPWLLTGVIGEKAVRSLSREMLLNPRLQQLGQKTLMALDQNRYTVAAKSLKEVNEILREEFPEMTPLLRDASEDELRDYFD